MRDIKFRGFDGKKMHDNNSIVVYLGRGWLENASFDPESIHIHSKVDLELMQFTGLTDRNEIDIYEGDLIKNGSARVCVVEWNEHIACFDSIVHKDSSTGNSLGFKCREWGGTNGVRVVGNIYEHRELLKTNKIEE